MYEQALKAKGYGPITTEIRASAGVLLRRGLSPAVPRQESRRLLRARRHRRFVSCRVSGQRLTTRRRVPRARRRLPQWRRGCARKRRAPRSACSTRARSRPLSSQQRAAGFHRARICRGRARDLPVPVRRRGLRPYREQARPGRAELRPAGGPALGAAGARGLLPEDPCAAGRADACSGARLPSRCASGMVTNLRSPDRNRPGCSCLRMPSSRGASRSCASCCRRRSG